MIASLTALAKALTDIVTLIPAVKAALTDFATFLTTV